MKGTLFSADFIFDSSGNARLLEINTDTGLTDYNVENNIDFTDFQSVISGSTFNTLHLIYKPFHTNIVNKLEEFISSSVPNITTITKQEESQDVKYITSVDDADDKFILRLAYDEAAILDSRFAKSELELYDLFAGNNDLESIVPVYISSSDRGLINNLTQSLNANNLPDFVTKTELAGATHSSIELYKLGLPDTGSDYRIDTFLSEVIDDGVAVTNFIPYMSASKVLSVRSMQITYGTDLDLCFIGEFKTPAIFDIPTNIVTGSQLVNTVDNKHRLEFTSNFPQGRPGIWNQHEIISSSGNAVSVVSLATGSNNLYRSYFVSGSPNTDSYAELNDWYHSGSTFPPGSHITSSYISSTKKYEGATQGIYKFELESGDSFYLGGTNTLPVLDTDSNVITWETVNRVKVGDKLFDENNTSSAIVSASFVISDTETEHNTISPNFEDVDTYIVKGTNKNLLIHNPPGFPGSYDFFYCFTADTPITLPDKTQKLIQDLVAGEEILTYDEILGINEPGTVGSVESREVDSTIEIVIDDSEVDLSIMPIRTTAEHPFCSNGEYVKAKDLSVGDTLQTLDGEFVSITSIVTIEGPTTVYNLHDVGENHNFYAHCILVHNK